MSETLRTIFRSLRAFDRLAPPPPRRPKSKRRDDDDDDDHLAGGGGGAGYGDSTALAIRTAILGT